MQRLLVAVVIGLAFVASIALSSARDTPREWLAGDSHIHSHLSPGYDRTQNPPAPVIGGDAKYSTPMNARKAREYGLRWMVTTDHGGPNHSKLNLVHAYAELRQSRASVPEVLQFYGMELNMPAMDHHTLFVPHADDEWKVLFNIESQHDANEAWPRDPSRNTEAAAFQALTYMNSLRRPPLLFANHPSRSATGIASVSWSRASCAAATTSLRESIGEWRAARGTRRRRSQPMAPSSSMRTGSRPAAAAPIGIRVQAPSAVSTK
jgi:hypothetical protein